MTMFVTAEDAEDAKKLAKDLLALRALGEQVATNWVGGHINASIEGTLERWIEKVRDIAKGHDALDYTITVGVPLGVSVSFTWPRKP